MSSPSSRFVFQFPANLCFTSTSSLRHSASEPECICPQAKESTVMIWTEPTPNRLLRINVLLLEVRIHRVAEESRACQFDGLYAAFVSIGLASALGAPHLPSHSLRDGIDSGFQHRVLRTARESPLNVLWVVGPEKACFLRASSEAFDPEDQPNTAMRYRPHLQGLNALCVMICVHPS
eukprot:CAMPEP_0114503698 /NCGR_PEP_ID=MMETSP0109-20121206/9793_1 /TAXON_ID=29199 /ORGANISM="Chlorarachnion reptans, Strain CCCM449" /LENGTH=177 /DNA_ID=CAMNT_0001681757 /DNA_START=13 /DNA_END=542 /DNA_ORIENTATION=-